MLLEIRSRCVLPALIGAFCLLCENVGFGVDCQPNAIDDACDIDCGAAGGPCDVPGCGSSADCNTNAIPDECEFIDCNGNCVPDDLDLSGGASQDCNTNGVPDECEPQCAPLEMVFFFDNSSSMVNDQPGVCDAITTALEQLEQEGALLESELRVIRPNASGVDCACCSSAPVDPEDCAPDPQHLCDSPYFGKCLPVGGDGNYEDWGFTTAVVAVNEEWSSPGRPMVFPVSDGGPRCGQAN